MYKKIIYVCDLLLFKPWKYVCLDFFLPDTAKFIHISIAFYGSSVVSIQCQRVESVFIEHKLFSEPAKSYEKCAFLENCHLGI